MAPTGILEGTWSTPELTCDQQNAALTKAGFSEADLMKGGWDRATCMGMYHGRRIQIRFTADRMLEFNDGEVGWDGTYRQVDATHIEAGDIGPDIGMFITYEFAIAGDVLTLDMIRDDMPVVNDTELLGERIAQTVIYESAPFARDGTGVAFASTIYPYVMSVPIDWEIHAANEDEDFMSGPDDVTLKVGSAIPEPGQTVKDRVAANRTTDFGGCMTDPALDRPTTMGGEPAILWSATCGTLLSVASNTIHHGRGYRLLVVLPAGADAMDRAVGFLTGFLESFRFTD